MKNPTGLLSTGSTGSVVPRLCACVSCGTGKPVEPVESNPVGLSRVLPRPGAMQGIAEHDFPLINSGNYFCP